MKRASAAVLVILGTTLGALPPVLAAAPEPTASSAETDLEPGPPPLASFIEPLGLSKPQQEKLRPMFAAVRAQVRNDIARARREGRKLDEPEVMAMLRTRDADLRERVAGVLSQQQLVAFDRLMEENLPRRSETVVRHGHHEMRTPQTSMGEGQPD